jgi:hypothetical protein
VKRQEKQVTETAKLVEEAKSVIDEIENRYESGNLPEEEVIMIDEFRVYRISNSSSSISSSSSCSRNSCSKISNSISKSIRASRTSSSTSSSSSSSRSGSSSSGISSSSSRSSSSSSSSSRSSSGSSSDSDTNISRNTKRKSTMEPFVSRSYPRPNPDLSFRHNTFQAFLENNNDVSLYYNQRDLDEGSQYNNSFLTNYQHDYENTMMLKQFDFHSDDHNDHLEFTWGNLTPRSLTSPLNLNGIFEQE